MLSDLDAVPPVADGDLRLPRSWCQNLSRPPHCSRPTLNRDRGDVSAANSFWPSQPLWPTATACEALGPCPNPFLSSSSYFPMTPPQASHQPAQIPGFTWEPAKAALLLAANGC
eukprot:GGOE01025681.1.p1 GENE.GGOE01025681.1~~GGOE01025681.1.p1  ORF type:complete len:114 (-),score=2.34 GGOE01025681.1:654-995(-)